ncbi:MAG: enoyl-CoA hydratase/isomerase family protein [Thermoanaerobaculia bacterium]|nr:enoyl-CoA hydratase/isomerase family protein [Thermoanaerobaculia bacterium]
MSTIQIEREGRTARLTVDRPPLNILDLSSLEALDTTLEELAGDPELQVLVVTGAGDKAFSAGVAVADHVGDRIEPMLQTFHSALRRLFRLPFLTVAAVDGHCLGGGLELAAVCDLILATPGSRLGVPEIKLGCYPPVAAALFPTRIGRGRALDLILTGETMEAREALRIGLIDAVAEDLENTIQERTRKVLGLSAAAIRLAKRATLAALQEPFEKALAEAERLYLEELVETEDMHEGIRAFLEKRKPEWKHR